jgi:hypothetical protein
MGLARNSDVSIGEYISAFVRLWSWKGLPNKDCGIGERLARIAGKWPAVGGFACPGIPRVLSASLN